MSGPTVTFVCSGGGSVLGFYVDGARKEKSDREVAIDDVLEALGCKVERVYASRSWIEGLEAKDGGECRLPAALRDVVIEGDST